MFLFTVARSALRLIHPPVQRALGALSLVVKRLEQDDHLPLAVAEIHTVTTIVV
jgi:hypothetical protein